MKLRRPSVWLVCAALIGAGLQEGHSQESRPITGIAFDWPTYRLEAPGSDNFPLTWCEDDNQYTSWGDGGGFGGTNTNGRVSLGFARVEGDYANFTGHNVWGGVDAEREARFDGKVTSMICINGNLYAWHSSGGGESALSWKQIIKSSDKGRTWIEDEFPQSRIVGNEAGRPGIPYFINYGQNYSLNRDGFVYIYTIRIDNPDTWRVQIPGVAWLARAPVANEAFTDIANWEWFTGLSGGAATWSPNSADRQPVLEDPDGMLRNSTIYVPAFDRYVMVTNHTARNEGHLAWWEAPEPWGPWRLFRKEFAWLNSETGAPDISNNATFGVFGPKWMGANGECAFVWFRPDAWNSVACQFLVDGTLDTSPPPRPGGLAATIISGARIDLSWSAVGDPESGVRFYNIYRDGRKVGSSNGTSFSDSDLDDATSYSYEVTAVNGVGLESEKSDAVTATTGARDLDVTISSIDVVTGRPYRVSEEALAVGSPMYVDRSFTLSSVPQTLRGLPYIQTANDDKNAEIGSSEFLSFDVDRAVTIYVAHDDRLERPAWLINGFSDSGLDLVSNQGGSFSLFARRYPAGRIMLGSNAAADQAQSSMYLVIVSPGSADIVPPAPPQGLRVISGP